MTIQSPEEDEIDIRELALAIWSGRRLIAATTVVGLLIGVAYGFTRPALFTSEAIFEVLPLSQTFEFAGLASLPQTGNVTNQSASIPDRVSGQDFILSIEDDLDLNNDPFFNPGPSALQNLLNLDIPLQRPQDQIVKSFKSNVTVAPTKGAALKITVKHNDPQRAAQIANKVMSQILDDLEKERRRDQDSRLKFLLEKLSAAQADSEKAQDELSAYISAHTIPQAKAQNGTSAPLLENSGNRQTSEPINATIGGSDSQEANTDIGTPAELMRLETAAEQAEIRYKVLTEQVTVQTLVTGYDGENARIYQTASPPLTPSEPKVFLLVVLGTLLGSMAGAGVTLLRTFRSGRLYSSQAIRDFSRAELMMEAPGLNLHQTDSLTNLSTKVDSVSSHQLSELLVTHNTSAPRVTLVASTAATLNALPTALWLARRLSVNGRRTALLHLGNTVIYGVDLTPCASQTTMTEGFADDIKLFAPIRKASIDTALTSGDLQALLSESDTNLDRFVICADLDQASLVNLAFRSEIGFKIVLARPKQTTRFAIEGVMPGHPIDAVLTFPK